MRKSLLLVVLALTPAVGCKWLDDIRHGNGGSGGDQARDRRRPLDTLAPADAVGYLNTRADRLQSVQYGEMRLKASDGKSWIPALSGDLVAAQPRNFRLVASGNLGGKVDLGSNEQRFWMYVNDTKQPLYVFCSHQDFESGRAKLPGGIQFEPDWVMQALGMVRFPAAREQDPQGVAYTVTPSRPDASPRTYTLAWTATTPAGQTVHKEVVFAADPANTARREPQVRRHVIKNANGKLIASADIKSAKTVDVTDATGQRVPVQYPTHVVLQWVEQKFEMDLTLDQAQVNQQFSDKQLQRLFTQPNLGTPPVDLANARFDFPSGR
jgi:hypothetical protein